MFEITSPAYYPLKPISDYTKDYIKALKKALKTKTYVYAYIQAYGPTNKYAGMEGKKYAKTTLFLLDKGGNIIKQIHATAIEDCESEEELNLEDVVLRSIDLATENFAKKDKLFSGLYKKGDTEYVSESGISFGVNTDHNFEIDKK